MRKLFLLACIFFSVHTSLAQGPSTLTDKLKVFIDCSNTYCDMVFIRSEINLVDFMLDRVASDVHVLITQQRTGSGGSEYQMIFFGQNNFSNIKDTLRFNTDPNATDFERRDLLIKYMQLGLAPFVAKTKNGALATISFKREQKEGEKKDSANKSTKDPWNYWVFKLGLNGNFQKDENFKYLSNNLSSDINRVTDKLKVGFNLNWNKQTQTYRIDTGQGQYRKIKIKNDSYNLENFLIKSLGPHWSYGYQVSYSKSDFSNNKGRAHFLTGFEYAIIPYKMVNTKYFTIGYVVDVRRNTYNDTTIFNKTKEWLYGQQLQSKLSFNQKWGTVAVGAEFHHYFHDFKYLNLNIYTELNIRITGGLSLSLYSFYELSRDQIFLPKGGATPEEVLTRQRQLASGYNVYAYFGINYRFGSKLNNFVNPRFD